MVDIALRNALIMQADIGAYLGKLAAEMADLSAFIQGYLRTPPAGAVTMNEKELRRLQAIQDLVAERIRPRHAARLLGLTPRQIHRLRERYTDRGPEGLISQQRGKPSNRAIPVPIRREVMRLLRTDYADFGPTFAARRLKEEQGISLSPGTLRRWMQQEGLLSGQRRRRMITHQRSADELSGRPVLSGRER